MAAALAALVFASCGAAVAGEAGRSRAGAGMNVVTTIRVLSPIRQEMTVQGEHGAPLRSLVLLPDPHSPMRSPRVAMAIHNFAGSSDDFAKLMHAERLRRLGLVVVLPQATGSLLPEWHGAGLTILFAVDEPGGRPDDLGRLAATLGEARRLFAPASADVDLIGFSQGATVALALARRLDAARPGTVRHLVLAAGSLAGGVDATLALPGTEVVLYDPGRNGVQHVANFLTGEPDSREFIPEMIAAKTCGLERREQARGVDRRIYRCADGHRLVHIYEATGEHAWPGQDPIDDSPLFGRGSISQVDLTGLIVELIRTGRIPPLPR